MDQATSKDSRVIAVALTEHQKWGCPYCGYRSGIMPLSGGGAGIWRCGECGKTCVLLAKGIEKSPIGLGNGTTTAYPELEEHPRIGILSHGDPDKRPENGNGEFFRSRGIGIDCAPGCFVCGGEFKLHSNICAFVQCKEAGERVVAMFGDLQEIKPGDRKILVGKGAWLDFRIHEPDRVQVKIGACNRHLKNLEKLEQLTREEGIITFEMISQARK